MFAGSTATASTLEKVAREGKIVFGHYPDSIPFAYFPSARDRKPVGYSIDLCLAIGEAVRKHLKLPHLRVEYRVVDGKTRFSDLEQSKIDVECGSSTNNIERRQRVAFTIPHFVGGLKILSHTSRPVQSLSELHGRTVARIKGGGDWYIIGPAIENGTKIKVLEGADTLSAFNLVKEGKADAMVWDDSVLAGLRGDAADPDAFVLSSRLLTVEALALMFRKNDPQFKKLVDDEMIRLIYSNELNKIYEKWFVQPIPPKGISLNYPMNFLTKNNLRYPSDKLGDDYFSIKGSMDH